MGYLLPFISTAWHFRARFDISPLRDVFSRAEIKLHLSHDFLEFGPTRIHTPNDYLERFSRSLQGSRS